MGVVAALGVGGRLIGRVAALGWVGRFFWGCVDSRRIPAEIAFLIAA